MSAPAEYEGQCGSCGVYRTDGKVPILHTSRCEVSDLRDAGSFQYVGKELPIRRLGTELALSLVKAHVGLYRKKSEVDA